MDNGQNENDTTELDEGPYHVVVVPMHGPPECTTYDSKDLVVAALKAIHGRRVSCFVFNGERWNISLPPRKLLNSDGRVVADLTSPSTNTPDPSGLMFDDPEVYDDDEFFKD